MEKKTMGSFITALRKAQGITQKELADRLNVSDKSVSRWECDDGCPDISMLPAIADIFGVTVDELLRGERNPEKSKEEKTASVGGDRKAAKELKRLRDMAISSFKGNSIIAIGFAVLGVLIAAVLNIGALRGQLGFLVGCMLLLVSVVWESVSINSVLSKDYGEVDDGTLVNTMIRFAEFTYCVALILLAFLLPLIVFMDDTYQGLSGASWLAYGGILAGTALVLSLVVVHFLNGVLVRKGAIALAEAKKAHYLKVHRFNTWSGVVLVCLLLLTVFIHISKTELWGPHSVMDGTVFNDVDSFAAFMEMDVPENPDWFQGPRASAHVLESSMEEDVALFDEYGWQISKEDAWRNTLKDLNGKVLVEYVHRNRNVISVTCNPGEGSVLPITVYTYDNLKAGQQIIRERNLIFGFVYGIELILFAVGYSLLRRRIK